MHTYRKTCKHSLGHRQAEEYSICIDGNFIQTDEHTFKKAETNRDRNRERQIYKCMVGQTYTHIKTRISLGSIVGMGDAGSGEPDETCRLQFCTSAQMTLMPNKAHISGRQGLTCSIGPIYLRSNGQTNRQTYRQTHAQGCIGRQILSDDTWTDSQK